MEMVDVAIVGASGYTALELFKLLLRHPHARVVAATSRDGQHPRVSELHPQLAGRVDLVTQEFDPDELARTVQCAFLALPHGAAQAAAAPLVERGVKVFDLSADYRLKNPTVYAQWYGESHADTLNLEHAVYGLPEIYRDEIRKARLIAVPGCYPTSAILALSPLLAGNLIEPRSIIIDSKSGVSGAGRSPKLTTHFPECNESVSAYNIGKHRHTPEIEQILSDVAQGPVQVLFTPHLIPMDRGILSTSYASLVRPMATEVLRQTYRDYYSAEPFVRVVDSAPGTKNVTHSNYCDVAVHVVQDRVVIVSAIDNLIKGASGAAVQCFNLVFGFPETTSLG
jgi:N-acetyl-gamma-glutamyl-phosphate reductase